MIYKPFADLKLSALGMGCMRLPVCDNDFSRIDLDAVKEMVAYALDNGVNYFDTAWGYHNGQSESVIGEVLSHHPRDRFYLATKFPGYDLNNMGKVEKIFEKQLQKCRVDYFDFYLVHNVCEANIEAYLDRSYGTVAYLLEQKRRGRIRHLGFSTHGTLETVKRFLAAYGEHMEFCQIQLNYLDWTLQNAEALVALLNAHHLPIWVMEPVRGGKLATLNDRYKQSLCKLRPEATAAEWAFRFIQSIPNVVVTLSGMSNFQQLKDNIATFSEDKPLTAHETDALLEIARDMLSATSLPCTACRYCTTHCPMELDIPTLINYYNDHIFANGFLAPMAVGAMPESKRPSACIGCRACEAVCPQEIKISDMMRQFAEALKL